MRSSDDLAARSTLLELFNTAVRSADPAEAVLENLPPRPAGRCVVVGSGKATAAMAAAVDRAWTEVALTGVVSTRYGHSVPAGRVRVIEASHPVPDDNSVIAAEMMLDAVSGLGPDDLVLCLMSGGASALATAPALGITLEEKRAINHQLLMSGAAIEEMNAVRQCLSRFKGGRLAAAAGPARVVTLVVSDVPGDDPAIVGSGPTIPRPGALALARAAIARHGLVLPQHIHDVMTINEFTRPRPGDSHVVIASARRALIAAAGAARDLGYAPLVLGDAIEGESRRVGTFLATIAESASMSGLPIEGPAVILSGGETTVTVRDGIGGRGGRNSETLLGAAIRLRGRDNVWALAADTDGIDGLGEAAGAMLTPDTLRRAEGMGLDAQSYLDRHDSGSFFQALGDAVVTGPTLTNVNDFRAFLIR